MPKQNQQIVQAAAAVMNQLKGTFSILNERLDNLAKSIAITQTLVEGHSKRIDDNQHSSEFLKGEVSQIIRDSDFSFDLKEKLLESDKFKDAVDSIVVDKIDQWPDFITRSISDAFNEHQYGDRIDELAASLKQVQSGFEKFNLADMKKELLDEMDARLVAIPKELQIDERIRNSIAEIPKAKDGKDGKDGTSVMLQDVVDECLLLLKEKSEKHIEKVLSEIPKPKDGKDGESVDRQEVLDACIPVLKDHAEYQIKVLWEKAWTKKSDNLLEECKSITASTIDGAQKSIEEKIKTEIGKIQIHDGIDGVDGRDALELQIESEIDERRTYNRGTYAMHKGGLWRAFERTNKMRGWECVVAGISDIDMKVSDSRHFALDVKLSNGESTTKAFDVPTMLFKGAWKSGTVYEQGDVVQMDGLWYANCDTDKQPGVKNSDWVLAVRRGQRGLPGDSVKVVKT